MRACGLGETSGVSAPFEKVFGIDMPPLFRISVAVPPMTEPSGWNIRKRFQAPEEAGAIADRINQK